MRKELFISIIGTIAVGGMIFGLLITPSGLRGIAVILVEGFMLLGALLYAR